MPDKSLEWYTRHLRAVGNAASEMHNTILEKTGKGPGIDSMTVRELQQWLYDQCKIQKSVKAQVLKGEHDA